MNISNLLVEVPVLSGVIFALVAWLKQMGIRGQWLTGSAFGSGLIIGMCYRYAVEPMADYPSWFLAALFGLLCGLTATGAYKGIEGATGAALMKDPPANDYDPLTDRPE